VESVSDRRQLFRVDDTAILDIVPISEEILKAQPAEDCFPLSDSFSLMRNIQSIDNDNAQLLRSIHDKSPDISAYFLAVNKKIETVAAVIARQILSEQAENISVDLSEGGIGFVLSHALDKGQHYAIKIWFNEKLTGVAAYIHVIACQQQSDASFRISCQFKKLSDVDEKLISRHIMQVQAKQQRLKKEMVD
tara:strand:+ start:422 stop:997 length:576 start_codon:yes stop_codon:yes gene_type:complete